MSDKPKETITLTFGDCAENHRGMQTMGLKAEKGLTNDDLIHIKATISKIIEAEHTDEERTPYDNISCDIIDLVDIENDLPEEIKSKLKGQMISAKILIIRNGICLFGQPSGACLYEEQNKFKRDTKAFMYGRVVNKKARHNLCFSDFDQVADYEKGKGTVINFTHTPILRYIRQNMAAILECSKLANLQCEANYYYDVKKTYIGFHGDTERRIVVGLRLGHQFPLHFRWYYKNQPISNLMSFQLNDGDIYIMSDKAVGYDWKTSSIYTLRHAAGLIENL